MNTFVQFFTWKLTHSIRFQTENEWNAKRNLVALALAVTYTITILIE